MNMERKTDEIINSLGRMQRAEAPPFLYTRITQKIDALKEVYTPMRIVWLAAASFLLLLALNVQEIRKTVVPAKRDSAKEIAMGYHLMNTSVIEYK